MVVRITSNNLPLLLKNMKRTFGKNINGPIEQRQREYQATVRPIFMSEIAQFLINRKITKLVAISSWKGKEDIKIAYHFVSQFGKENKDSKITIITFLNKEKLEIESIKKIYPNARIFEKDIEEKHGIKFLNK